MTESALGLGEEQRRLVRGEIDRFVSDFDGSGELEKLEDTLSEFNLFQALGTINAEIRHSNFLAWLLRPYENHGLGDVVVKRLLQRSLMQLSDTRPIAPVDLDLMDLSDLEVRREWANIDILLASRSNGLVVVIENKIGASESKGQLERYRNRVLKDFPEEGELRWRHLFLYLTIEGDISSDDAYIPISYRQLVDLLDAVVRNREAALPPGVKVAILHYVQMLRREHMEDSNLIRLARAVYVKHKLALDFIFDNLPNHWSDARDVITAHLVKLPVISEFSTMTFVRFYPEAWKQWAAHLSQGTGWKSGGCEQMMLCEIRPDSEKKRARLQLVLGPGPENIRDSLIDKLKETSILTGKAYPSWTTLVAKPWRDLEGEDDGDPQKSAERLISDVKSFLADEAVRVASALELAFGTA